MDEERRNEKRFRLSRMVAYDMEREQYIRAHWFEISKGGMAFLSTEYVEPDCVVWLSFSIPEEDGSWRQLEAEGRVREVSSIPSGTRFGVAFTRMADEDRVALDAFLDRLEREDGEPSDAGVPDGPSA